MGDANDKQQSRALEAQNLAHENFRPKFPVDRFYMIIR